METHDVLIDFASHFQSLYSLEKPIEWKHRRVLEAGEYDAFYITLYSLEKPIEWKLERPGNPPAMTALVFSLLARETN